MLILKKLKVGRQSMFEGIVSTNSISFILVFIEGLLSFFSPCVIPLIPVYMGYLAGNGKKVGKDGTIIYERKKVFFHTVCFVLGISFAFFILGMSFSVLGAFFQSRKLLFTRIGGIIIIVLGLFQLGIFDFNFLQRERKFQLDLGKKNTNPLIAFIMGFTFSFAWTPCVGPALSSVLILASGASSNFIGNMLVFVYAIGFIIPFLLLGLFTTQVLNFLKQHQKFLKYTVKAGAILLIIIGAMTFTGWMNNISGYLNTFVPPSYTDNNQKQQTSQEEQIKDSPDNMDKEIAENKNGNSADSIPAFDFTLLDQYGTEHTLSDYKGKVVFLNFWATWCPPCKEEMPYIEYFYNEYNKNMDDIVILGIANPKTEQYPYNQELDKDGVIEFLKENEYTFPVLFDETGEVFNKYHIAAFPTTFLIDKEGNIHGYAPGMLTKDMMRNIIQQTLDSTK